VRGFDLVVDELGSDDRFQDDGDGMGSRRQAADAAERLFPTFPASVPLRPALDLMALTATVVPRDVRGKISNDVAVSSLAIIIKANMAKEIPSQKPVEWPRSRRRCHADHL
jgi:hypothetical protein